MRPPDASLLGESVFGGRIIFGRKRPYHFGQIGFRRPHHFRAQKSVLFRANRFSEAASFRAPLIEFGVRHACRTCAQYDIRIIYGRVHVSSRRHRVYQCDTPGLAQWDFYIKGGILLRNLQGYIRHFMANFGLCGSRCQIKPLNPNR